MSVSLLQRSSGIPLADPGKNAAEVGDLGNGVDAPVTFNAEDDKVRVDVVLPVLVDVVDVNATVPGWGSLSTTDFASVAAGEEDIKAGLSVMSLDSFKPFHGAGFGRSLSPVGRRSGVQYFPVGLAILDSLGGGLLTSDADAGSRMFRPTIASVFCSPLKALLALICSFGRSPIGAAMTTTSSYASGLENSVFVDPQTPGCFSIRSSDGVIGQHDFMVNDRSIHNDSVANTLATVHTHAREF